MRKTDRDAYERLCAVWERRLEAEGLGEIETRTGSLRQPSSELVRAALMQDSREEYYRQARAYLHSAWFPPGKETYDVWFQHAEGLSVYEIYENLKEKHGLTSVNAVWSMVQRIRRSMLEWVSAGSPEV